MKKMTYRILSVLVAIILAASAVGCGTRVEEEEIWLSGEDSIETIVHSSGTQNDGTVSTNSDGITDVEGITSDGSDKYDLKGATVVIGYYRSGDGGKPSASSPTYQDEIKLISDVEKKYNCKIEFKNAADSMAFYRAWTAAAQAGTKFCDILQIATSVVYPSHMTAGYLTKLDSYLDMNSVIYNQRAMDQTKINGGHYITVMSNRLYASYGIYFNRKVFDAFGIDTPDAYVKANQWDWNKFVEVAKATTGVKGGVQYYGYGFKNIDVDRWAVSNGAQMVVKNNGRYVFNMASEPYIKAIQHTYDLFNTHKVTGGTWTDGNVAMLIDLPDDGQKYMEALGSSNVGFTYIPKGPDVSTYNVSVNETTSWGIPSTVKNPDVMAKIMYDMTYPYKWRQTLEQQQESNFGDATSMQVAMDIAVRGNDNINLTPLYSYIREISLSDFGIKSQISPRAYVASVSAAAQAELDAVWGQ